MVLLLTTAGSIALMMLFAPWFMPRRAAAPVPPPEAPAALDFRDLELDIPEEALTSI